MFLSGDCSKVMQAIRPNSVDTILTDPPYGLKFMGKEFDNLGEGAQMQAWHTRWASEALRVAKPGAFLIAFGGTRTYHRLACALEDAGWIIRDTLCWLYGSGWPKSLDIGKAIDKQAGAERTVVADSPWGPRAIKPKEGVLSNRGPAGGAGAITIPATDAACIWDGWGTALKPAWEPIVVAMKPLDGTFVDNAKKWGVAGLNIEGARIDAPGEPVGSSGRWGMRPERGWNQNSVPYETTDRFLHDRGRWPANLLLGCACESEDHEPDCPVRMLDEQVGPQKSGGTPLARKSAKTQTAFGDFNGQENPNGIGSSSGGVSRFFYTAKASRSERERGLIGKLPCAVCGGLDTETHPGRDGQPQSCFRNDHPTVKPVSLMRYLARLTKTPAGGIVLDPFMGSGSTGIAALQEDRPFIGIDQEPHYLRIATARMDFGPSSDDSALPQLRLAL